MKIADFIAVPHRYSLIRAQIPRRNPFIPMYSEALARFGDILLRNVKWLRCDIFALQKRYIRLATNIKGLTPFYLLKLRSMSLLASF